ncbi:hypothetical protein [Actinoplanes sp. NPDC023714]|uniref:hypothetical protein n=1 Tax=Actinoplanes sp. NPDC023714 TaxID=3154322 RepID=UPI003402437F
MLQLLGGIAVAGVVAAGSTAFTASGVTNSGGFTKIVGGGTTTMTVEGAVLTSAKLKADATDANKIVGATLDLTASGGMTLPTTSTVSGVLKGTDSGNNAATSKALTCTYSSGTVWNCTVANTGTDYLTAVTDLDVSVVVA